MDALRQDLRYALRTLRGRPGFTAAALACLALGIGANTAAFSVVHGVLFRALPFEEPDRIVSVEAVSQARGVRDGGLTFADLEDLRASGVFADVAGVSTRSVTLTGGDRAERVQGAAVTPNAFALLGRPPAMGRDFRPEDAAPAGFEQVVLVSHALWQRRFGGAPDVVGRTLRLNGRELVIVGVMEEGFRFPETQDVWLPLGSETASDRAGRWVWGVARLADGLDPAGATDRLAPLSAELAGTFPESHRSWAFAVRPFRARFVHPIAQQLLGLMLGAVGFVLLVACANVGNLLLARAVDREEEVSIRVALGAGRGRVFRQLLTEAVVLGLAGAALGWAVAVWSVEWFVGWIPEDLAYWIRIEMDGPILAFTLGLALLTAVLFGTAPALRTSRIAAPGPGGRAAGTRRGASLRGVLVTTEVALSLVLLVGAGLMIRSFLRLDAADPGFATADVLSFRTVLAGDRYDPAGAKAAFHQTAVERLAAIPGVVGATATSAIPADDGGPSLGVSTREETPAEERVTVTLVASTAGFFSALGVELLEGRELTASEARDPASDVVVVGADLARRIWPEGGAVGRRLHVEGGGWYRVVGVAPDLQYEEFGEETASSRLQLHVPDGVFDSRGAAFLVRAGSDAAGVAAAVRAELAALDGDLAPYDFLTMDERLRLTTWPQRFFAGLFAGYGLMALVLALTGIYGVVAYDVTRRRREIGVRMALGASRSTVTRGVVVQAARLAAVGTVLGVAGALLLSRGMRGVLYGVRETDLVTFVLVAVVMAGAALLAGWLPARRIARLEPSDALRSE